MLLKPSFAAEHAPSKRANSVSSVSSRQMNVVPDTRNLNESKLNKSGSSHRFSNVSNGPRFKQAPRFYRGLNNSNGNQSLNTSMASSVAPFSVPIEVQSKYEQQISSMFTSPEFKQSTSRRAKKDLVGNVIYQYVLKLIGEEKAPKVTGMLIDLPEAELNLTISQWTNFEKKVFSAF